MVAIVALSGVSLAATASAGSATPRLYTVAATEACLRSLPDAVAGLPPATPPYPPAPFVYRFRPTTFDRRSADSSERGTATGERAYTWEPSSVSSRACTPLVPTSSRCTRATSSATSLSNGVTRPSQKRAGERLCEVACGPYLSPAGLQRRGDRHPKPVLRPLRATGEDTPAGYGSPQVAEGSNLQIADAASACTA
jgi:hypothetical protein